ncbi:MAG: LysR family transcriptional regulator [Verrucomicrobiales bacterium]|nr:LysR family transcriptional regulator [Verrucomicrobiales bacterium]
MSSQPLDSRQLRAFSLLAKTGSFTLAAKELFLSQSAVSHSMKALEQDVGCRLLERVGKRVVLTQAGEQLLMHAEKILHEMGSARSSLEQLSKWGRGRLRVGASTTACQYILPTVLREFKESFSQCLISIEPGDTPEALDMLRTNKVDLALVLEPHHEEQMEFHPLFVDELAFLVSPLHPWVLNGHVTRLEIPRQNYILYNKNSYTFRMVEDYFKQEDMILNTVVELGSMEATKELVKLGLGVSIVAPWIAQKELQERSVVVMPLGKRKLKRTWGIAYWKGKRLSLSEETFVGLCKTVCESLTSDIAIQIQETVKSLEKPILTGGSS